MMLPWSVFCIESTVFEASHGNALGLYRDLPVDLFGRNHASDDLVDEVGVEHPVTRTVHIPARLEPVELLTLRDLLQAGDLMSREAHGHVLRVE